MDDAANSPDPKTTVPIPAAAAQETTLEVLKERMEKTMERFETRVSMSPTMIHKFPRRLRGLGGEDNRYIVPGVVAIGPYHHGLSHLQETEAMKHVVACRMCRDSGRSVEDVYAKIVSIASDARRCYDADDVKVKGLSDAEFATMMFLDACFLVWYMSSGEDDPLYRECAISAGPSFLKDIAMLENQIPWLVLEALMEFRCRPVDVESFLYGEFLEGAFLHHHHHHHLMKQDNDTAAAAHRPLLWIKRSAQRLLQAFLEKCGAAGHVVPDPSPKQKTKNDPTTTDGETSIIIRHANLKPPHLLGLMRFILIHGRTTSSSSPDEEEGTGRGRSGGSGEDDRNDDDDDSSSESESDNGWSFSMTTTRISAVDLAQKGVKVSASTAECFADMKVNNKNQLLVVFAQLSLSPMSMDDVDACCLVNLAALEAAQASTASSFASDGYVVSSYLSVLAMLMDSEDDVQELRKKGVLCSHFSNAQTLAFFKGFGQHLRLGYDYFRIVGEIQEYMRRRPVRIAVHKFVYNNYKLIVAVLSIASVLVGIFKAIYSLKQKPA